LKHVRSRAITEIINKILLTEGLEKSSEEYRQNRLDLVIALLKKFKESQNVEELENIAYIFTEFI